MQHKTQESSNNNSNHIFIVAHTHTVITQEAEMG